MFPSLTLKTNKGLSRVLQLFLGKVGYCFFISPNIVMAILRFFGLIVFFLTRAVIEPSCRYHLPGFDLVWVGVSNFVSVTVLCLTWHGLSLRCLGEIVVLTSLGITFQLVTENVNEMLEGKRGLVLAFIAGHIATVLMGLIWYAFIFLLSLIFG